MFHAMQSRAAAPCMLCWCKKHLLLVPGITHQLAAAASTLDLRPPLSFTQLLHDSI
jgi:hypothetical protein